MLLAQNLSSNNMYPPNPTVIHTVKSAFMPHSKHCVSKLMLIDDFLENVHYLNKNNTFHEIFKLKVGPCLTAISLTDLKTQFYEADHTIKTYTPHTIHNFERYLNGMGMEPEPNLAE